MRQLAITLACGVLALGAVGCGDKTKEITAADARAARPELFVVVISLVLSPQPAGGSASTPHASVIASCLMGSTARARPRSRLGSGMSITPRRSIILARLRRPARSRCRS